MLAQIAAISIFLIMFALIITEKIERHYTKTSVAKPHPRVV